MYKKSAIERVNKSIKPSIPAINQSISIIVSETLAGALLVNK